MTPTAGSIDDLGINTIRTLSIDTVEKAASGHPGLPMGAATMAYRAVHPAPPPRPGRPGVDEPRPLRALRRTSAPLAP